MAKKQSKAALNTAELRQQAENIKKDIATANFILCQVGTVVSGMKTYGEFQLSSHATDGFVEGLKGMIFEAQMRTCVSSANLDRLTSALKSENSQATK